MMQVIKLIECIETIDNWGNVKTYKNSDLFKLLITPEDWTDDQLFIGDDGSYFIDDLIGERVIVGTISFIVGIDKGVVDF